VALALPVGMLNADLLPFIAGGDLYKLALVFVPLPLVTRGVAQFKSMVRYPADATVRKQGTLAVLLISVLAKRF